MISENTGLENPSYIKSRDVSDVTNFTNLSNLHKQKQKKENQISDFTKKEKKQKKMQKKNNVHCIPLEGLEDNIDLIRMKYFERIENEYKAEEFRAKYHKFLRGGYFDLLLLIKEYPDFNLFEYINTDLSLHGLESSKAKFLRKKTLTMRNNLFLRILLEASYCYSSTTERNKSILEDLSFMKPHIETFKSILCEREKSVEMEVDVEVMFLSILGYKDKAKAIVYKFHDYFKNFISDFSEGESYKGIFENLEAICDKEFCDLTNEELIVLRKIINNCVKRKFYRGIEFLCYHENFCFAMSEGRIWKSITKYIQVDHILKIWDLFSISVHKSKQLLKSTIQEEYRKRLAQLKDEDPETKHERKEKLLDISLDHVYNLSSFLVIIFKCNRNDIANELITHTLATQNQSADLEIFDVCLEYDEDISIGLIDQAINSDNAKDYHMKLALMKKYFRLSCKLLRYKQCKSYLNLPKPKDDNEEYLFTMNWLQLMEKKKQWDNQERQGFKDKNENNQNYFRLLSMVSRNEEALPYTHKKENETIQEEMNQEQEKILIESSVNAKQKFGTTYVFPSKELKEFNEIVPYKVAEKGTSNEKLKSLVDPLKADKLEGFKGYNTIVDKMKGMFRIETNNKSMDNSTLKNLNYEYDDRSLFNPDARSIKASEDDKKQEEEIEMMNFLKKKTTPQRTPDIQIDYSKDDNAEPPMRNKLKTSMMSMVQSDLNNQSSRGNEERGVSVKNMNSNLGFNRNRDKYSNISFSDLIHSKIQINVQMILIDHLRWGQYTFYCISLLSSISERYLNTEYSEKICKSLIIFTRDEEAISRCRNPLILCVLTAEFLKKLGKLNSKYQYKCQSIADMFLKLGECLQSSIKDEEMLNYYLREQTDHKNRSALEIIAENRFYDLLNDDNVATIVGKLWYGIGRDLSIFKFCRMSRILSANLKHEHYKDVVSSNYKNKVFSFQYCEYTKNCSVRYLIDSFSTIMTTILYQFIIYFYVSLSSEDKEPSEDVFFSNLNYIANIVVFSINLNLLMYLLYVYMTNRTMKITAFVLLDVLMFFGVLCNFIKVPNLIYQNDKDSIRFLDAIIYSVIIVCAWMRVIGILMTTRSFGPFLRIIYLLLSTFLNFLLVFFATNTVFAQVFTLLFKGTNVDFKGFFSSWIALFNTSFGINDFTHFTIMEVFGYSLLMAYTTLTNIMLLNLVVAIINNLFHVFEKKADAENRAVLVLTYERIKWDEQYGLLILLPAPLNCVSLPFLIILIFAKDKYKTDLNTMFTKICYIFIALGNFFTLVMLSLLLLPFAYLKSLIHSAYDHTGKVTIANFGYVFFHIMTRPFIFLFYILEDIKNFWRLCYKDNLLEGKENKKSVVSRDIILALRKVLLDFRFEQKKKIISIDELYTRLKLNRKGKNNNKFLTTKTDSSIEGSESDKNSDNKSIEESARNYPSSTNIHESINTGSRKTDSFSELPFLNNEAVLSVPERNIAFRYLIDKIVDKDRFIDIERTLFILPSRVMYTDLFMHSITYLNMRVVLRGLQKYFFLNAVINPVYSYKKLQQLIYKIMIKFKMIYHYLPENQMNNLKTEFEAVNFDEKFSKNFENMLKMEQNDELSDYDDQVLLDEMAKSPQKMSSKIISSISNNNISGDNSPSDYVPSNR